MTVDATVGYQDPQSGSQAIPINGLENHLLCPMQCCLNGVHTNEVPMFLAESHCKTSHAIEMLPTI